MRSVVAYELLSLDGVAEHPDQFVAWDDELDENLGRVIASQDTVLLGRKSYDEWARYWPGPGLEIEPFASFINGVEKFVFTSTPLDQDWTNASRVDGDLVEFVTGLKQQSGGDIGVHASITLTQALLAADLVDELRLVVAPVVQLDGRRLFENVKATRLSLKRSAVSPSGYQMLDLEVLR
ncbi:MAG TPA: dihydrofolate reductase family protein [Gaiellaceae bacterium]|jgi:dihydrofolate reductase